MNSLGYYVNYLKNKFHSYQINIIINYINYGENLWPQYYRRYTKLLE